MKTKRPASVTVIIFGVLIFVILFWVRFAYPLINPEPFAEYALSVSPTYFMATGFLFGATGLPLIWGLWTGQHWAQPATWAFYGALIFYYWFDRLTFTISDAAQSNTLFAIGLTVAVVVDIWFTWRDSKTKDFFAKKDLTGESDDERSKT